MTDSSTPTEQTAAEGDATARGLLPAASVPVRIRVRRQDGFELPRTRRWEEFVVEVQARMTVADVLAAIEQRPITASGQTVEPVAWDSACADTACGACTMLINGRPRPACSTLVESVMGKRHKIELMPLSKFPLVRDLVVDRSEMSRALAHVHAWQTLDSERPSARSPVAEEVSRELEAVSRCTGCGACLEACPEYHSGRDFVGAAALNEVHRLNLLGAPGRAERLEAVMGRGGVADCGKAHNCVEVCPQSIPLVDSIQSLSRATTLRFVVSWLLGKNG
jgi:succinate dehydrogenase / fumarate reductase iron-sulfur subunit